MAGKMQYIFLFGHRKQHGKDTCVTLLQNYFISKNISYKNTYFAKMLKKHVAERYGLDFERMGDDSYKNSKPAHLGGLSVRDVLIKEGCGARAIWQNVWAFPVYEELLTSDDRVGLVSDFRYPNEYSCFDECFDILVRKTPLLKPKVIKVLVHRPAGKFVNDGADDQLPDVTNYWDHTIVNDDRSDTWRANLDNQLKNMIQLYIGD